ncbi:MAG: metalloregulator ArsR/SmtB family transcription factor [Actinobacteria bacterium]|nr:metalloregulator ArsR/SmtB family transcription factor [Actinomycetota bacterium]
MANRFASTTSALEVERIFKALADPTRRAVVERLRRGPAATTKLASGFDMALPSFLQHLGVLEDSGLVTSHKHGRVRTYWLVAEPLRAAESWLSEQRELWERRLDQLDEHLHRMKQDLEKEDEP